MTAHSTIEEKILQKNDVKSKSSSHMMVVGFDWSDIQRRNSSTHASQAFTDSEVTDKSKRGFGYTVVPSPHPLILNRPTPLDLSYSGLEEFKQPEVDKSWKEKFLSSFYHVKVEEPSKRLERIQMPPIIEDWVSYDDGKSHRDLGGTKEVGMYNCPNAYKHMVPRAVLMRTGLKTVKNANPLSTVRSVNTVRPFSTAKFVNTVRPYNTAHPKPTVSCARPKTHFQNQAQRPFYKNTALTKRSNIQNINTGKQIVNTVRPNVNTVRARGFNAINSSLNEKGFVDRDAQGTCLEKHSPTFHISKNLMRNVLVLSPNFKMPDEVKYSKNSRQNNMYSFDMKNIVPKDGSNLSRLQKATLRNQCYG
ncbi:hypothetical protein Tco_0444514 [Tanacetum coccineum]